MYNFDFMANLNQKMGMLRNYIKEHRPRKQSKYARHYDSHPKELNILKHFNEENPKPTHLMKVSPKAEEREAGDVRVQGVSTNEEKNESVPEEKR